MTCCGIILTWPCYIKCVYMDSIEVFMENLLGCTRGTFCLYSIWDHGLVCDIMFWTVKFLRYVCSWTWNDGHVWGMLFVGKLTLVMFDEKIYACNGGCKLWYMYMVKVWWCGMISRPSVPKSLVKISRPWSRNFGYCKWEIKEILRMMLPKFSYFKIIGDNWCFRPNLVY